MAHQLCHFDTGRLEVTSFVLGGGQSPHRSSQHYISRSFEGSQETCGPVGGFHVGNMAVGTKVNNLAYLLKAKKMPLGLALFALRISERTNPETFDLFPILSLGPRCNTKTDFTQH